METAYVILNDGGTYEARLACEEDNFPEQVALARRAELVVYAGIVDGQKVAMVKDIIAEINHGRNFSPEALEKRLA